MNAILQTTLLTAYSQMKILNFYKKKSLKFIPKCPINNIPALVQIMAFCLACAKQSSEAMLEYR